MNVLEGAGLLVAGVLLLCRMAWGLAWWKGLDFKCMLNNFIMVSEIFSNIQEYYKYSINKNQTFDYLLRLGASWARTFPAEAWHFGLEFILNAWQIISPWSVLLCQMAWGLAWWQELYFKCMTNNFIMINGMFRNIPSL